MLYWSCRVRSVRVACLVLAVVVLSTSDPLSASARPNVLLICSDDHSAEVYGAYGNMQVRTPTLDRLAGDGVRFERAYCNSPVCTASRQSFLTGRYPRTIGVTQLRTALPAEETTLAEVLGEAGYRTAAIGKMHFNSNLRHGFETRIDAPQWRQALQQRGPRPLPEGIEVLPQWRPFRDPAGVWLNGFYRPYPAVDADMLGTFLAEQSAEWLANLEQDEPFFLIVSFYEPHSPFHFPIEYHGRHNPDSFDVPQPGPEDDWQIPAIFRDLTDEEKRGIRASYYTSVEFMDKNVAHVLEALEQTGRADETLLIYIGDHGYLLGEHGRFEKHSSWEPAIRAPLVVRYPEAFAGGRVSDALVEFVDLVPTLLEICDVPIPAEVQGRSLVPLLAGETDAHRSHVVVEYSENEEACVVDRRWKLVYTTGQRERQDGYTTGRPLPGRTIRLYDRQSDPDELRNVAGEHPQRVADMTAQLAEHLVATARRPEALPQTDDLHVLIDFCLRPDDVTDEPAGE